MGNASEKHGEKTLVMKSRYKSLIKKPSKKGMVY